MCFGWRRWWQPTPVLLPGKSHGQRSLVGCSSWGREESDMTERLHFHFSLLFIGEVNGNPLQCSCLENPRDGWAWWAAVYGVAQSWTRLKRLSSSSSSKYSSTSEMTDIQLSRQSGKKKIIYEQTSFPVWIMCLGSQSVYNCWRGTFVKDSIKSCILFLLGNNFVFFLDQINKYILYHDLLLVVWLFETPWTVDCQAPWSMGFLRQE